MLTPPDDEVTTIDPNSTAPFQVARGSSGGAGISRRRCSSRRAPTRRWRCPTARRARPRRCRCARPSSPPAASRRSRARCPATSARPTPVEFTLDEAIAAGAAVGRVRQAGHQLHRQLHRARRSAAPCRPRTTTAARASGSRRPTARVIKITGESDGKALVDADETPGADTPESLAALGITDAERAQLAALYEPGTSCGASRSSTSRRGTTTTPTARRPARSRRSSRSSCGRTRTIPCNRKGSIIACESQTLGEEIPLTGTRCRCATTPAASPAIARAGSSRSRSPTGRCRRSSRASS